jgi:hypothetical protein
MLIAAGPNKTTNRAGNIKIRSGKISFTGSLAAFSSAF